MTSMYHNPRCSKSRATLALLEENGITVEPILYLQTPPTLSQLKTIVAQLGFQSPRQLLRTGQAEYITCELDKAECSDTDIFNAMIAYPILIERPIVIHNDKAMIGRPPEAVLALFNE